MRAESLSFMLHAESRYYLPLTWLYLPPSSFGHLLCTQSMQLSIMVAYLQLKQKKKAAGPRKRAPAAVKKTAPAPEKISAPRDEPTKEQVR